MRVNGKGVQKERVKVTITQKVGEMQLYHLSVLEKDGLPIVASLPHSGTYVPRSILKQFKRDPRIILPNMDWHLDKLYDFLPALGITLVRATHSRYIVNLNRDFCQPYFGPERSCIIPEATTQKKFLYESAISQSEQEERIKKYYVPYHQKLTQLLDEVIRRFGTVYLLDLHSYFKGPAADVCLGNANDTTCSERLIGGMESALARNGFKVTRNEIWTGGYITRHYGNLDNVEALQVEIRLSSYLEGEEFGEEEITSWDSDKFGRTKKRLKAAFEDFICDFFVHR
jgi:N-formylglutamate deformylase